MLPIAILPVQPASVPTSAGSIGAQAAGSSGSGLTGLLASAPATDTAVDTGQDLCFAMLMPGAGDGGTASLLLQAVPVVDTVAAATAPVPQYPVPVGDSGEGDAADDETLALLAALVAGAQPIPGPPLPSEAEVPTTDALPSAIDGLIADWQLEPRIQDMVQTWPTQASSPVMATPANTATSAGSPAPATKAFVPGPTPPIAAADLGGSILSSVEAVPSEPTAAAVAPKTWPAVPEPQVPVLAEEVPVGPVVTQPVAGLSAVASAAQQEMTSDDAEGSAPTSVQPAVATGLPRPIAGAGPRRQPEAGSIPAIPVTDDGEVADPAVALQSIQPTDAVRVPAVPAGSAARSTVLQQDRAEPVDAPQAPNLASSSSTTPITSAGAEHPSASTPSIEAQAFADEPATAQVHATAGPGPTQTAFGDLVNSQRIGQPMAPVRAERPSAAQPEPNPMERAVANQVSRAIIQHLPDGGTRMVMRLTPPELGTVRVEFVIRDGTMTARLLAEDDGVRQALDRALPQIRSDVRGEHPTIDITVDRSDQRQSWQEQQARQERHGEQQAGSQQRRQDGDEVFSLDGAETAPLVQVQRVERTLGGLVGAGRVDAFA
jgi:flagellar hook-length control protein FliK